MSNYYYLGLVDIEVGFRTNKALVKAEDGHYLAPGNAVAFYAYGKQVMAPVSNVAYVRYGSDEEAIMLALAPVYTAEKIYNMSWTKKEEEENDGN